MNMNPMHPTRARRILTIAPALWLAMATVAIAAGLTDMEATVDGYTIRWSTAVTGFLPRSMVEKHHLGSSGRGVLNVVILEPTEEGKAGDTVKGDVSVTAYNLASQLRTIDMHPVRINDRTSYIGTFDIHHGDELDFTIHVRPPGMEQPFTVEFERRFLLRGDDKE
ncbi:MAG: DUF4426 domain-containing protein [Gammaproteobacteria bacterium]|nr:DUF4426 domain-containing protein [Gammaproteobacteria bacterium]